MKSLKIGDFETLKVVSSSLEGFELEGGVRLPMREVREEVYAGRTLEVFLYSGSKGEIFATQYKPFLRVGDIGYLRVTDVQEMGAFVDWGLHKELFLPAREQTAKLQPGDWISVFVFLDDNNRLAASMRVEAFLHPASPGYQEGDAVNLHILSKTPLGYKAVVDQATLGILYQNEIFQPLKEGQQITGYVKKVRNDGKIDLALQQSGYRDCDQTVGKILEALEKSGGVLSLGDKSSAEAIYEKFGVSKKKFKMALGALYKKRLVSLTDHQITRSQPLK